jgi:hypothetical protein
MDIYWKDPDSTEAWLITNPNPDQSPAVLITPENKYTGFSISLNKRFSDGWMFHLDYTYSVAKGNHANTYTGGSGGGNYYYNPNRQINAYGPLQYDAPHYLHIYGTVELPLGFNLTPRFLLRSGRNWNRYLYNYWAGRVPIRIEERGSRRLPFRKTFDLRLEKVFKFPGRTRIGVILDMFNVFNWAVEENIESNIAYAAYGKAIRTDVWPGITAPRYVRLGLRFFF